MYVIFKGSICGRNFRQNTGDGKANRQNWYLSLTAIDSQAPNIDTMSPGGDFIIPPPLHVAPSLYQVTRLTIATRLAIQWRTIEPIICCAANTFDRRDWPHSIIHLICKLFTENKWDYLLLRLHISALHKFTYGKHILAKLENYYANNQQWFSRKKSEIQTDERTLKIVDWNLCHIESCNDRSPSW